MKTLLLIRHAEADHHIRAITGGWTDTDLTEKGRNQSALLAARLREAVHGAPLHLGSSDLRRALQTAEIIRDAIQRPLHVYSELRDLNNGVAAGKTHVEAREYATHPTEPILDWQPYPEAESWRQFYMRITAFMDAFSGCNENNTILVTHLAVVHVIVAWWLRINVESNTNFETAPASLTVLTVNKYGERTVERLNDTGHLFAAGLHEALRL